MKKAMKKGFTLVELVIVIAVIAILSAILIPTFGNVISDARRTSAQTEARNAMNNFQIAANENGSDTFNWTDGYAIVLSNRSTVGTITSTDATANTAITVSDGDKGWNAKNVQYIFKYTTIGGLEAMDKNSGIDFSTLTGETYAQLSSVMANANTKVISSTGIYLLDGAVENVTGTAPATSANIKVKVVFISMPVAA
jgi:prepilin-type N-terminal cleavage/methylation domain-containing protein